MIKAWISHNACSSKKAHFYLKFCKNKLKLRKFNMVVAVRVCYEQGHYHGFLTGGGDESWPGMDSGESKPPTPKFLFLLGFCPLYFGNIGKYKSFSKYYKIFFKNHNFWGTFPRILNWGGGGHIPRIPRWRHSWVWVPIYFLHKTKNTCGIWSKINLLLPAIQ